MLENMRLKILVGLKQKTNQTKLKERNTPCLAYILIKAHVHRQNHMKIEMFCINFIVILVWLLKLSHLHVQNMSAGIIPKDKNE